jgi:hypothetical protein
MRFLPVNLDVRNEPGEENEVDLTVAKNLVRNMDIATFRVSRGWQHKTTVVAPGQPHHTPFCFYMPMSAIGP